MLINDPINYRDPFGLEKDKNLRDTRVRDFLTDKLGGTLVEGGEVHNTRGEVPYVEAVRRLTSMGFEHYFDPHWDLWGGWDYEGKICGVWYQVTLGYPNMSTVGITSREIPGRSCKSIRITGHRTIIGEMMTTSL